MRDAKGEEIEVERPVDGGREGDELAAVLGLRGRVDVLERGRLAAEAGPVIDDLEDELARERVDRRHARGTITPSSPPRLEP